MGFNVHGLAFKQSMMILVGISIVFVALFGVLSSQVQSRLSTLLTQKSEEISQANVAIIEKLFDTGKSLGDDLAQTFGNEPLNGKELDDFLSHSLLNARTVLPQVLAVVVAYEPGFAPNSEKDAEVMRLAQYSEKGVVLLDGKNYQKKIWYASTKKEQRGIWQEPFIGDFIKEPIAIYTVPFYRTDPSGNRVFAGVLCVDMSIAFLKETIASIPVSDSGYVVVLSANNTIIAHPQSDVTFKETLQSIAQKGYSVKEFENSVHKLKNGLFVGTSLDGEEAVIYFNSMAINGWTFLIVWPARIYMESQRSMTLLFIWLCIGGYIIMLLIVLAISFRISKPLKKLAAAADKLAHGDFDAAIPRMLGHDEMAQFASAFSNMRTSLKAHIEKQKNLDQIDRDLEFARRIQLGILPKDEKEENTEGESHELAPFLKPAKEVGGDFYDFFKIDDDHICIAVGDVSGKGVPASLFMMVSRIVLRTSIKNTKSVVETFNSTNYSLAKRNKLNMFVTVWMGIVDLRTGQIEYVSAGHNPPAVCHSDGSTEFMQSKSGLVMAAMEETRYKLQTYALKPGDMLFLYTDGVTEATNKNNELFGDPRLLETLSNCGGKNPQETCKYIKEQIDAFVGDAPQFDDITMLAFKFNGSLKANAPFEKTVEVKPENQLELTSFVEEVVEPLQGSMKAKMQLDVAIDEIYSNIVKFSGATQVTLSIEVQKDPLQVKLSFIDNGAFYNPLEKEDPDVTLSAEEREIGGLGIFIVKKTMDNVEYCRKNDHNVFTITKKL